MVIDLFAFLKNDVDYIILIVQNLSVAPQHLQNKVSGFILALSFPLNQIVG